MKPFFLLLVLMSATVLFAQARFDDHFEHKTMRIDFFHSGNAESEQFAIDDIRCDGLWSGSCKLIGDPLNLGLYRAVVTDSENGTELFTDGFASIFGEWQTIEEARTNWGTFHESLRIPWPKKPVVVRIEKRDPENRFQPLWEKTVDPAYRQVNPKVPAAAYRSFTIWGEDDPEHKLDIVILGDGYKSEEIEKFRSDARRLGTVLLDAEPYRSMKDRITLRAVETAAAESGVTRPHSGLFRNSPLSVRYSAFDSQRYALTTNNRAVRNAAATVPYDFTIILMNERTYGGGGIYKLYATVAADNAFSDYIVIHEMGHHLAALADEYYTSAVAYNTDSPITVEPWEKNVTAFLDGTCKWSHLITKGTPLPTPWDKEAFEEYGRSIESRRSDIRRRQAPESEMEELFQMQRRAEQTLFGRMKYKGRVGLFEGANYRSKGYFRSSVDCIMFTRSMKFCPVCQDTIARVIEQYSPSDS